MITLAASKARIFIAHAVLLQRLEGLAALGFGVAAYAWLGQSWLVFGLLFLSPDMFMLGYLRSARFGALSYNLAHTYVAPVVLACLGLVIGPVALGLAAIWVAHIGLDRMLGYGLKLEAGFGETHLGGSGRTKRTEGALF